MSARKVARRQFLKTGSAAAIGLSVVAGTPNLFAAALGERGFRPLLSVGHASSLPEAGESVRLSAADKVLTGDPAFISRGARVTIRSFERGSRYNGVVGGAAIEVLYPAIGYAPEKYPRFRAWGYSVDQNGLENIGSAIGFNVAVTATQGLQFLIGGAGKDEATRLALTFGSQPGTTKLQRGVYIVAFRESASDSLPPWSALSVSQKNGRYVLDTQAFSYAVLTIDYAE